ncbi:MAG: ribosome recycling factor [Bacilli bacterium]|nr:ribosome recycling factor [Bacilli bacterium]
MDYEEILLECETRMEEAITSLEKRFTNVRAGRANPNMLDGIKVEYYGTETPLKQLANISIPEARQLSIKPFDKSILGDIEKAVFEANIGLTPNNNGEAIFLVIPALTEERRREFVKQVKAIAEEAKIALRNIRQDANSDIKKLKLPEDTEKRGNEEVQNLINKYNKLIEEKLSTKEKELMTI